MVVFVLKIGQFFPPGKKFQENSLSRSTEKKLISTPDVLNYFSVTLDTMSHLMTQTFFRHIYYICLQLRVEVTSPPNSIPRRFPSYLLLPLLLRFLFIFYFLRCTLQDFSSISSRASLPFLLCCHNQELPQP